VTRGNEARHVAFARAVRDEHGAIVDAIEAHDPDAARRMAARHMQQAALRLAAGGVIARPPAATKTGRRAKSTP